MKYFLVAGEKSGDLHGGNLINAIKAKDGAAEFLGFGGDEMLTKGMLVVKHYKSMAFMGAWEVVKNLGEIRKNEALCKKTIIESKPDVVILIDYAGFNLRIAKFCKQKGIKVFYYIAPKVWAWNTKRALGIKKNVDRLFCILPFEKEFFGTFDYEVDYVGNPVVDAVTQYEVNGAVQDALLKAANGKKIVAVLPGSRKQEVVSMLALFTEVMKELRQYHFVVAKVDNLDPAVYQIMEGLENCSALTGKTYDLLAISDAALVCSGTATLETALWGVPQLVAYKTSKLTYAIAKRVVKVPYISLVNLIYGKELVQELIQDACNTSTIQENLLGLLEDPAKRKGIQEGYAKIKDLLGEEPASQRAAGLMLERLKNT